MAFKTREKQALIAAGRALLAVAVLAGITSATTVRTAAAVPVTAEPARHAPRLQIATTTILVQTIVVPVGPANMSTIPPPAMTAIRQHAMMSALTEFVPADPAAAVAATLIAQEPVTVKLPLVITSA